MKWKQRDRVLPAKMDKYPVNAPTGARGPRAAGVRGADGGHEKGVRIHQFSAMRRHLKVTKDLDQLAHRPVDLTPRLRKRGAV